jgi:hypothetical protein
MSTMTLKILTDEMHRYNNAKAYGSECHAWGDYCNHCFDRYSVMPWDDSAEEIEPVQDFVDYWLMVAHEKPGSDYDETGSRY